MSLTKGTQKAIELINENNNKKLFENKKLIDPQIILPYRVFFILLDREDFNKEKNDEIFFERICEYFIENSPDGKIGIFLLFYFYL